MHYFILDTNVYIHYRYFDSMDWLAILSADMAVLLVPVVVITELDKKKYEGSTQKERKRAQQVISRFHVLLDKSEPRQLRPGVTVSFIDSDPQIDWKGEGLSQTSADDHIIGFAMWFQREHPSDTVTLITADFGSLLKCRVKGISVSEPPEEFREDTVDPETKELMALRSELSRLKAARPDVKVVFTRTSQNWTRLSRTHGRVPYDVEALVLARERELAYEPSETKPSTSTDLESMIRAGFATPSKEEVERYLKEVAIHLVQYRKFLEESNRFARRAALRYGLVFCLVNTGGAPADDIDLVMHFPDGFIVSDQTEKPPTEPKRPQSPMSLSDMVLRGSNFLSLPHLDSGLADRIGVIGPTNGPRIRRTHSYEVNYEIPSLKHNMRHFLDQLWIQFDSEASVQGFQIDYRVSLANHPDLLTGTLNVDFEPLPSNAPDHA